jgi:hypothetical protein
MVAISKLISIITQLFQLYSHGGKQVLKVIFGLSFFKQLSLGIFQGGLEFLGF